MNAAAPAAPVLLSIEHLRVYFRSQVPGLGSAAPRFQAVGGEQGVSLQIPENTTLAVVGESGSGKSVTAMSVLNLLPSNAEREGRILFQGQDLLQASPAVLQRVRGREIACVFQDPMSSLNPVLSIGQQLCEPLMVHLGLSRRQAMAQAQALLAEVQLSEPAQRLRRYPHQLSGGQQQRVMIAMAMACQPKLLIADEPTTALDVTVQRQILALLARLKERYRMSMLFISHDLGVVAEVADQVVVMRHGDVRERGPAAQVLRSPVDPSTRALVACRALLDTGTARAPADAQAPVVLEARGLQQHYWVRRGLWGRTPFHALGGQAPGEAVSFQLRRGQTLGVVGESGSGKTTLGMTLLRLQARGAAPHAGQILFKGRDMRDFSAAELLAWRRQMQVVFQNPYASLNPRLTIRQTLLEPLRIHQLGRDAQTREDTVRHLLHRVGLDDTALGKYPHEFSGGQRQRIAIARCLTLQPEVLVLDEAVSALDMSVQAQVLKLLKDLQAEFGLAYLFISHDLSVVRFMADEVMVMKEGRVVEQGSAEQLWRAPQHAYSQQLLAAVPRLPGPAHGL
ncbi:MAG: dipeptide ABC transporter ATP-binding protein [Pseudomonadota bacterium]